MSVSQRKCSGCTFYKTMGTKGFCFKHGKVILPSDPACKHFNVKIDDSSKRRLFFDEKGVERRVGGEGSESGIIDMDRPDRWVGLEPSKEGSVKGRIFLDVETDEAEAQVREAQGAADQGQKLFLFILIGGLIVLIAVLIAAGVI